MTDAPLFVPISNEMVPLLESLLEAAKRGEISSVAALVSTGTDQSFIVTSQPLARAFLDSQSAMALDGLLREYGRIPGMMFDRVDI